MLVRKDSKENDFLYFFLAVRMSFGSAPEFSISETHKINIFVLHKAFLKAIKLGVIIFPNTLHQQGAKSQKLNMHNFITIFLQNNLIVQCILKGHFLFLHISKEKDKIK